MMIYAMMTMRVATSVKLIVLFKQRDLLKMFRVFLWRKISCSFLIFFLSYEEASSELKKCRHTCVAVLLYADLTIRITYVHVGGAGILIINTGNTTSSFYANARSKTPKSAKK